MTNGTLTSKTRERLIDVARQLFSSNGLENTTMSDIASASDKGRRTIYTYFRTKHEIYEAVIQSESKKVCGELQHLVDSAPSPELKLRKLMEFRMHLADRTANRPEVWLKSLFSSDSKRDNRIRAYVKDYVLETMDSILKLGVESGTFDPVQSARVPELLTVFVLGNDWARLGELKGSNAESTSAIPYMTSTIDFIIDAITTKSAPTINNQTINPNNQ